jgi:hypothetical protein
MDSPELRIIKLPIHNHGFKHGTFPNNKFDHSVDDDQQIPERQMAKLHTNPTLNKLAEQLIIITSPLDYT